MELPMGQMWTDEMEAEIQRRELAQNGPPTATSAYLDADLRYSDLLLGAGLHLLTLFRRQVLRAPLPERSLADELAYAQFCRQLNEPVPELGSDASDIEKWLAADLDPFEGLECYRA